DSSNLARSIGLTDWRDEVKVYPPGEDPLHLHDLRHTAFTIMADGGATVLDIKAVAGHSTVKMTEHYARPGIAAARRVGGRATAPPSQAMYPRGSENDVQERENPRLSRGFAWWLRPASIR